MTDRPGDQWEADQRRLAQERRSRIHRERVADATEVAEARAERLGRRVSELEAELRRMAAQGGLAAREASEERLRQAEVDAREAKARAARLNGELKKIRASRAWRAARMVSALKRSGGRPTVIRAAFLRRRAAAQPIPPTQPARKRRPGADSTKPLVDDLSPRVAVVAHVPAAGPSIVTMIDSVLDQTLAGIELILYGEGVHQDDVAVALEQASHLNQVLLLRGSGDELGERAARLASARYLCQLGDPLILGPTYLEKAVTVLDRNPSVASVSAWIRTGEGDLWRQSPGTRSSHSAPPGGSVVRARPLAAGAARVITEPLLAEILPPGPLDAVEVDRLATAASQRRVHRGPNGIRPVVLTLPWWTGGGGGSVVGMLSRHWREQGRKVVAITTLELGSGMVDRFGDLLELTPYAYHLPRLLPERKWVPFVRDVIAAQDDPVWLNINSPWAYSAMPALRAHFPKLRIIDQQYNTVGHMTANSSARTNIDLTLAVYPDLVNDLLRDGRKPESVEMLPIGIPRLQMPDDAEIAAVRASLGIPEGNRVICFIGRLSPEKRPEWALALASDLASEPALSVVIIGDGGLAETLRPGIEAVPGLIWRRALDRVEPLMAGSDLVILPSEIEGISLVAMEAIQIGLPVVATSVGGMPSIGDDPLVDLCDPDDYSDFLATVRAVLGRGRPERVTRPDAFSLDEMLEAYDRAIDERAG